MKKILIIYASYGNGHKSIANYIKNYVEIENKYEVTAIDILDYVDRFTKLSAKIYIYLFSHRFDYLITSVYKLTDNKIFRILNNIYSKNIISNKKLEKVICDINPDLTIATHFYANNIISKLNKRHKTESKLMTIVTDYKIHDFWLSCKDKNEMFIVANDIVKEEMIKRKCFSKKIYPYGLPFNIFQLNKLPSDKKIYKKYSINPTRKVILFFGGGGEGKQSYFKYYKELLKMNTSAEIIFVAGKDKKLKERALELQKKLHKKHVHVYGFVTEVLELMKIANLIITKPGGATVTECLEMKKVMMLLPSVAVERYNAKFVSKNNHGFSINFMFTFKSNITKFMQGSNKFKKYQDSYNNVDSNNSLSKIYNLINETLE